MEMFIRIVDGLPFGHPIMRENFVQCFPDVDLNNLPSEFCKFERVEKPILGIYEIAEHSYGVFDQVVKDVWTTRPMSQEEIKDKQDTAKSEWFKNCGFSSWVFVEETCSFRPPIMYPNDGQKYRWDEETTSWKVME